MGDWMSTSQFEELKKMFENWKIEIRLGSKPSTQEAPQEKTSIKIQQAVLEEKITQQVASKTVTLKPDPLLLVVSVLKTKEPHHVRREVVETVTSNPPVAIAFEAAASMLEPTDSMGDGEVTMSQLMEAIMGIHATLNRINSSLDKANKAMDPTKSTLVAELHEEKVTKQQVTSETETSKGNLSLLVLLEPEMPNHTVVLEVAETKQPEPQTVEAGMTPTIVPVVESRFLVEAGALSTMCDWYVAKEKNVVLGATMDYHSTMTHQQMLLLLTMFFVSRVPQFLLSCGCLDTMSWSLRTSSESKGGVMIRDYG
ncbi:unnamed protein product [Arabidopsis halleri]